MDRRRFLGRSLAGVASATAAIEASLFGDERADDNRRLRSLAPEYTVLWRAADPMNEIGYCPALARLSTGRLIGCMLHAGTDTEKQREWMVKVHTSDDRGRTWAHRIDVPMIDCFPFEAGSSVYVIGGRHDLTIIRSDDQGATWTPPVKLTSGKLWYCHPGSAVFAGGRIYFVMEQIMAPIEHGFPTHVFAPVVMSARMSDDLTDPDAWTFSNTLSFQDVIEQNGEPNLLGVPFYSPGRHEPAPGRNAASVLG